LVTEEIDLSENLVAHYLLKNDASDELGSYDGIASTSVDFQDDKAVFDGIDGRIPISTWDSNRQYEKVTVSANVTVKDISSHQVIYHHLYVTNGAGSIINSGFTLNIIDGIFYISYCVKYLETYTTSLGKTVTSYSISASDTSLKAKVGKTYNVVGVIDNNNASLYIDGVLKVTVSSTQSIRYAKSSSSSVNIGELYYPTKVPLHIRNWKGSISNLRIYDEAKDQDFIRSLYNEG
jgi:hypothetical protein